MKTLGILLSTAGLAGAGVIALAVPAEAAPAAGCPGAKTISSAPIQRFHQPPSFGDIRLKRDSCSQYWAVITMDERLPKYAVASAYLIQYGGSDAGRVLSCDTSGGTGAVLPRQRTCRTPKVRSTDVSATFVAQAREFHDYGGGFAKISENQTDRTR